MRPFLMRWLVILPLTATACLNPTQPRLTIGEDLVLELLVPKDTVINESKFTLTVRLRNDGQIPMIFSGSGCLARHTVSLRGREVAFPFTGRNLNCAAVTWSFTLAPGEESSSNLETFGVLGEGVQLPAEFTVDTELFFDLTIDQRTVRPRPKLRDTFVIADSTR